MDGLKEKPSKIKARQLRRWIEEQEALSVPVYFGHKLEPYSTNEDDYGKVYEFRLKN